MLAIARSASSVRLALLGALTSLAIQACGGGDANPSGAGSGTTSDGATPNVADAASRDGAASGNGMTGSDSTTNSDNPIDDATSNDGTSTTGSDGTTNHDGTTATPDDSGSNNGPSDSSADSSGERHDAAPPNDGAPSSVDANDVPEGGAPVTPKQVACGGPCDTTANTCCVQTDGTATCVPGASTTCPARSATIHCLSALDCAAAGSHCCGSFDLLNNTASTVCSTQSCPSGLTGAQFCRTNSECPSGTCTVQVCPSPAKPGTTQQTLELCGGVHFGCAAR